MGTQGQFSLASFEDGVLTLALEPPVAIGGWQLQLQINRYPGSSSGLINKFAASGYATGQSGITIVNSGIGVVNANLWGGTDMSGRDPGNYWYQFKRLDSGYVTGLAQGYFVVPY